MKAYRNRINWIIIFCLFLVAAGILLQMEINRSFNRNVEVLDEGWELTIDGVDQGTITQSLFKMPVLDRGAQVMLKTKLKGTRFQQTVLRIRSRYSAVRVYLDNGIIYEYGKVYYDQGKLIGNGYHWIALPQDYAGGELRIEYLVGEKDAFQSLDQIILMDSVQVHADLTSRNLMTVVIACCLLAIGLISIFFIVLIGSKDSRFQMLLWLGSFAISVSTWLMCNGRLLDVYCRDLATLCIIEYLSMYGACISMIFFVSVFFTEEAEKKLFKYMGLSFVLICGILTMLSVNDIIHYPKTVRIFHIVALVATVIIILILIRESKREKKAESVFLAGIVCFFICVLLELFRYRYNKICLPIHTLNQSLVPVGAMFFILAMFGSFFCRVMERVSEELERKTLYDMAYRDALTNLHNRAWCEKVMQDYSSAGKPVTMVNLDLNLFKEVNDTYGHTKGDELLIRFADILSTTFRKSDCVGRMGGDEFIVIADYMPDEMVEQHLEKLQKKIRETNKKSGYEYEISVAFGYASDAVGDENPWKVYEQADVAMYANKKNIRK